MLYPYLTLWVILKNGPNKVLTINKMTNYNINFDFNGADTMYLTHSLHPYPAKFPPQLPNTILSKYGVKGQTVLDPFCGSGTTLVEARLLGFNSIGVDVNGLSSLLSKVKSTPLTDYEICMVNDFIIMIEHYITMFNTICKFEKIPSI